MTDAQLHPDAHALTAFRAVGAAGRERGRLYTATTFPLNPRQGCGRVIRQARSFGYIADSGDGYAVLDVLDRDGDIVQDYVIRSATAFAWFRRRLDWEVFVTDGDPL